jgi:hypothetical protein
MTGRPTRLWPAAAALLLLSLAGCDQIGAGIGIVAQAIPKTVDAAYKGLAGQQVIVMVWADRGVQLDNPLLQEEVAAAVQDKLIKIQADENPDALKGTTFPVDTATVVQYQADHPELEYQSATDVAARFNASRLLYIEVTDYSTRSDASLELYRGIMTAHVSVVEMREAGPDHHVTTKVGYDGGTINVAYPPKDMNKDGVPGGTDSVIGQKTVEEFADDMVKRFYKHDEDRT